jgi:hypothetical protein
LGKLQSDLEEKHLLIAEAQLLQAAVDLIKKISIQVRERKAFLLLEAK